MPTSRKPSNSTTRPTDQGELFAAGTGPPGFLYQPEFLSAAEEATLIQAIAALPLQEARYKDYTAKRRIAYFGFGYDFITNKLEAAAPIPHFLLPLRTKVAEWLGVAAADFRHALATEYRPGTPLGWHRDAPQFALVAGISLAAACRMRFRPFPHRAGRRDALDLELAPRSAYVLRGDVRWRWQHSIPATRALRYSLTFRTLA